MIQNGGLRVTSPASPAPLLTARADPDEDCLVLADSAGHEARLFLDEVGRLLAAETPLGRTLPNGKTGLPEPRQVLLDSSYMNPADHAALWKELDSILTP